MRLSHLSVRARRWLPLLAALAVVFLSVSPAAADLIVAAENVTGVAPGSTGDTLQVTLTNTGPSSVNIGTFTFGLSVSSPLITFTEANISTTSPYIYAGNSLFGPVISTTPPGQSLIASDSPVVSGINSGAGSTVGLGNVLFNVDVSTPAGSFFDVFVNPFQTSLSDDSGVTVAITTLQNGGITVAGVPSVPEPASLTLVGISLVTCLGGYWAKRRSRSQAGPLLAERNPLPAEARE